MKNRKIIIGFVGALAALYLFHYFSTDQIISRRLKTLVAKISHKGPVPQLKQLTLASNISEFFHPETEVTMTSQVRGTATVKKRSSVRDHVLAMYRVIEYLECKVTNLKVTKADDEVVAKAEIKVQLSEEKDHFEIVPFLFIFKKHDGEWLITSLKNENPIGF